MRRIVQVAALFGAFVFLRGEFTGGGSGGGRPGDIFVEANARDGLASADDEAFRDALVLADSSDAGTIVLGQGAYVLEDSLLIQIDGLIIQGAGRADIGNWTRGTTLWIRESGSDLGRTGILVGHKADSSVTRSVQIRDLTIRCDQTNRIGHCLWARNVQNFTLENVDIYANSLYGGDGDGVYAAYYLESATNSTSGNAGTTGNTAINCHIYCPRGQSGSGKGNGFLAQTTGSGGFNTGSRFLGCRWSNAVSPGRSIFLSGHKCLDSDDCTEIGAVNEFAFTECRIDGEIGIEFCASSRNYWSGAIDLNPDNGDTCIFVQAESEENTLRGGFDGFVYDEQSNPNLRSTFWSTSWNEGPVLPGVAFIPRTASQLPVALPGHPLSYPYMVPLSDVKKVLWYWSATEVETLAVAP